MMQEAAPSYATLSVLRSTLLHCILGQHHLLSKLKVRGHRQVLVHFRIRDDKPLAANGDER